MGSMCGRANLTASGEELAEEFALSAAPSLAPRYNIAPSEPLLAVRASPSGGREAALLQWGLVRPTSLDAKAPINLRLESLARGAMKSTARERRCIVPLSGFYEWRRAGKARQPFNVRRKDGRVFGVAGLWDRLESGNRSLESCLVLTTAANRVVGAIHERMPVMLAAAGYAAWLDASPLESRELVGRLELLPEEDLEAYPVSPLVNRAGVEDPRCLEPTSPLTLW
jgi:putative SOS response-associated peptidase YedK